MTVSHKLDDGRRSNSESGCVIGFIGLSSEDLELAAGSIERNTIKKLAFDV
jgi:hypothetical protein